jgi:calcineurin-like phosphoesterase family protein
MKQHLYPIFAEKWLRGGAIYFYSDPHFADEEMKYLRKNYIGDDEQIRRIKSKIGKCDTLIILGDIGDPTPLKQIKGYKVLICGNHDRGASYYEEYFNEVYIGPLFISDRIILSHEPINLPFALNIHGHDHSNSEQVAPHHLNLCAEHIDYEPVAFKKIIQYGLLKDIPSIHRITVDNAIIRKEKRENENN